MKRTFNVLLNTDGVESPIEYIVAYADAFSKRDNVYLDIITDSKQKAIELEGELIKSGLSLKDLQLGIKYNFPKDINKYNFFLNNLITYGLYKRNTSYIARELKIAYNIYNNNEKEVLIWNTH